MRTLLPPRLEVVSSLSEQCDRCAAAARLRFVSPTGGELTFCGHHANRYADDILLRAEQIAVEDGFDWRGAARTAH